MYMYSIVHSTCRPRWEKGSQENSDPISNFNLMKNGAKFKLFNHLPAIPPIDVYVIQEQVQ